VPVLGSFEQVIIPIALKMQEEIRKNAKKISAECMKNRHSVDRMIVPAEFLIRMRQRCSSGQDYTRTTLCISA